MYGCRELFAELAGLFEIPRGMSSVEVVMDLYSFLEGFSWCKELELDRSVGRTHIFNALRLLGFSAADRYGYLAAVSNGRKFYVAGSGRRVGVFRVDDRVLSAIRYVFVFNYQSYIYFRPARGKLVKSVSAVFKMFGELLDGFAVGAVHNRVFNEYALSFFARLGDGSTLSGELYVDKLLFEAVKQLADKSRSDEYSSAYWSEFAGERDAVRWAGEVEDVYFTARALDA